MSVVQIDIAALRRDMDALLARIDHHNPVQREREINAFAARVAPMLDQMPPADAAQIRAEITREFAAGMYRGGYAPAVRRAHRPIPKWLWAIFCALLGFLILSILTAAPHG